MNHIQRGILALIGTTIASAATAHAIDDIFANSGKFKPTIAFSDTY